MVERDVGKVVRELAAAQRGVMLSSQVIARSSRGAFRHAVESGRLINVSGCAYALAGTRVGFHERAKSALLQAGNGAALSHESAATLFGFEGFARDELHVSMAARRKLTLPGVITHRPRPFPFINIDGLEATGIARTIIDCGETLRGFPLEVLVDEAQQRFAGLVGRVRAELGLIKNLCAVPGAHELLRLLNERDGQASDSREELRLWRLIRRSDLPPAVLQYVVRDENRERVMAVDIAFVPQRVAVHYDSYKYHWRRTTFDDDAVKRSTLARLDWVNYIVTKATLDSEQCIEDLRHLLAAREPQRSLF